MRTYLTILVCDRCQKQREYKYDQSRRDPDKEIRHGGWAVWWPAHVTPFGCGSGDYNAPTQTVCLDCLSPDELEQVASYQPDEFPPGF